MKKLIILSGILLSGLLAVGQTVWNTSAGAARFVCESDASFTQTYANQEPCIDREVRLYYYYRPDTTLSSTNLFTILANSGSLDCAVKVWKFDSKAEANTGYITETPLVDQSYTYTQNVAHALTKGKFYLLELTVHDCDAVVNFTSEDGGYFGDSWHEEECAGCLGGFEPEGGVYILSAWVMDKDADLGTVEYDKPHIEVTSGSTVTDCIPRGEIIDGWQRIEMEVVVEEDESVSIELVCELDGDCMFDDIRFFPKDASMVTYVYDPLTLRLMAELDERNYAKIYEYDEQGKLIRVKKETEMGIMTIQENRENNSKE